jgi:PIN domain nuclease of toxin-antitoxin system
MSEIVLDTCGLLAWVDGRPLPVPAGRLLVSAVTWCEIAWKHRLGALPLSYPRDAWIARVEAAGIETAAIDRATLLAAVDLDWPHRDPADRMIVALARARQAPLFTCDRTIAAFYPRACW